MLAVTVRYQIKAPHVAAFRVAILRQAQNSREKEPGCRGFDVCFSDDDPQAVFLYEVYDDADAFAAHRQTEHFHQYGATVADWIESKEVQTWTVHSK
jgi:quinol monooxygenase YgiN